MIDKPKPKPCDICKGDGEETPGRVCDNCVGIGVDPIHWHQYIEWLRHGIQSALLDLRAGKGPGNVSEAKATLTRLLEMS